MLLDSMKILTTGHLIIDQYIDEEAVKDNIIEKRLIDQHNEIHPENMSYAIANSLGNFDVGPIQKMCFGRGGSTINTLGEIVYLPENIVGQSADLYDETYSKIVDGNNIGNPDPEKNYMEVQHISGNLYTDLLIHCTLGYNEPTDQSTYDQGAFDNTNKYAFDEIGLKDYSGNLITHVIFSKIEKSLNRIISVKYRLRIQMV